MTKIGRTLLLLLIALLMLINTTFLLKQIWGAESALHKRYRDPTDRFIYAQAIKKSLGKWVRGKNGWEWRSVPEETVKAELSRREGLIRGYNQQLNQIYERHGTRNAFDLWFNSTEAERRTVSDLQAKRARAREFQEQLAFNYDINKQPRNLPGKAIHRLVKFGRVYSWQTQHDDSISSRFRRWLASHSFGPINSKVSPAVVGATRTAIYASIVSYLLISALILIPGVVGYRRL